ncbi:MAG TPA: NTP transferase domain-containing protein, partial [Propionibacteriaceae bacterium]|nr:NTP transferase domain-containing protein [Propionibacteriaceae bacterium]
MSSEPAGVTAVVVLAAGGGTRMKSRRSKLLHELCGRSMLSYAITAATSLEPDHLVVVVGHEREQVSAHLAEIAPYAVQAVQEPQLGTGHAVRVGLDALDELPAEVVVTYGDVPLLTGETLAGLVAEHRAAANAVTVLTSVVDVPTGYGRVVREHGRVSRVVEEKDASDDERDIREINSGIYVFDAATLREGLAELRTDNAQG